MHYGTPIETESRLYRNSTVCLLTILETDCRTGAAILNGKCPH